MMNAKTRATQIMILRSRSALVKFVVTITLPAGLETNVPGTTCVQVMVAGKDAISSVSLLITAKISMA